MWAKSDISNYNEENMNMDIISLADFKKIPSVSIYENDVLVIRAKDIPFIPKPKYPVRIKYFLFVCCTEGSARFSINTKVFKINKNQFLLTTSDCVMEFYEINDFKGTFLVVSHDYMKGLTSPLAAAWKRLAAISNSAVFDITEKEKSSAAEYIDKMARTCRDESVLFKNEVLQHQIIAFLYEMCGFESVVNIETSLHDMDRNEEIYSEFMSLVIRNIKEEHSVQFYADKMNVTPKYLSIAVKKASGKTPSECIQKVLIQEVMVLLKNTTMPLKDIVSILNFPTATFFCRYFKHHTGMSPNEYRSKSL